LVTSPKLAATHQSDSATSGHIFPVPVSFDDETPTPDFCRILLSVDEMTVKKPLVGKARATNAEIAASFGDGVVQVNVVVNGNQVRRRYEYRKPLPYDVIAEKCRCEVMAGTPARIVLVLAKSTRQSWAAQRKYFIAPPTK